MKFYFSIFSLGKINRTLKRLVNSVNFSPFRLRVVQANRKKRRNQLYGYRLFLFSSLPLLLRLFDIGPAHVTRKIKIKIQIFFFKFAFIMILHSFLMPTKDVFFVVVMSLIFFVPDVETDIFQPITSKLRAATAEVVKFNEAHGIERRVLTAERTTSISFFFSSTSVRCNPVRIRQ